MEVKLYKVELTGPPYFWIRPKESTSTCDRCLSRSTKAVPIELEAVEPYSGPMPKLCTHWGLFAADNSTAERLAKAYEGLDLAPATFVRHRNASYKPDPRFRDLPFRAIHTSVQLEIEPILTDRSFYSVCPKCGLIGANPKAVIDSGHERGLVFKRSPVSNPGIVALPGGGFSAVTERLKEDLEDSDPGRYTFSYIGLALG